MIRRTHGEKKGDTALSLVGATFTSVFWTPLSTKKNSHFAKHHLAVFRQHDTEPLANSVQNINFPAKPQQDFAKFFDGESVQQEDFVMWVNLGMHHYTRAEDIPVTLYSEAYSSMVFAPQNFFHRAQDGDLLNRRWVNTSAAGELQYDAYGVALPDCAVTLEEPALGVLPSLTI